MRRRAAAARFKRLEARMNNIAQSLAAAAAAGINSRDWCQGKGRLGGSSAHSAIMSSAHAGAVRWHRWNDAASNTPVRTCRIGVIATSRWWGCGWRGWGSGGANACTVEWLAGGAAVGGGDATLWQLAGWLARLAGYWQ
jgi:hypothetical protein